MMNIIKEGVVNAYSTGVHILSMLTLFPILFSVNCAQLIVLDLQHIKIEIENIQ